MSTWEEQFAAERSPLAASQPAPDLDADMDTVRALLSTTVPKSVVVKQLAESLGVPPAVIAQAYGPVTIAPIDTYRLDGPEPPPPVVRLRVAHSDNPGTADVPHVARCAHAGWWWCTPDGVPDRRVGWHWRGQGDHERTILTPVYPVVPNAAEAPMLDSLARALPADENYYRVATDPTGTPVWAYWDGDAWDAEVSQTNPDGD